MRSNLGFGFNLKLVLGFRLELKIVENTNLVSIFDVVDELDGGDEREVVALHGEHDEVESDEELGLVELVVLVEVRQTPYPRQLRAIQPRPREELQRRAPQHVPVCTRIKIGI